MSRHDTGTKAFSFERVVWEIQRAFYSFKNSPVLALLLMQRPLSLCRRKAQERFILI